MYEDNYLSWKNWGEINFGLVRPGSLFYFDQIFKNISLKKSKILEIGFGNGELLSYFREKGHDVFGVEVNSELVKIANNLGYSAYYGDVWNISELTKEIFNLIIAVSVLEHMDYNQLKMFFSWVEKHLYDNGKLVIIFPEGASPLGLANQNGDFTHLTTLTKAKIEALCISNKLRIISYKDDLLSSNKLCSFGITGKIILLFLQYYSIIIKFLIRTILFPVATSLRLGTNSIVVIKKDNPS